MNDPLEQSKALFIRRWGEMSGYWGINRTMAELHALLYISSEPLNTDQIMAALQISRGNASMNIRQLVNWGLINRTHHMGDRKEYFGAQTDVWEMFETIVRERRRREVEPIIETIIRCRQLASDSQRQEAKVYRERLDNMAGFLSLINELVNMLLAGGQGGLGQMRRTLKAEK